MKNEPPTKREPKRSKRLCVWFAGVYLVLLGVAVVFPEDVWYPVGIFIKMIPGTLLWPFVLLLEKVGSTSTIPWVVLYLIFGPALFWFIGLVISIAATRMFSSRNEARA